ncbi:MAG: hypothetical protein ACRDIE_25450 [Chloroflexota bacterium]
MEDDDWLTLKEAALLSGKGYTTLYSQARLGNLPTETRDDHTLRKSGGGAVIVVRRADLHAYLDRIAERKARDPLSNAERQRRKYAKKKSESST